MRWNKPNANDIKIKKKFAILPIQVDNEVRWLEMVTVKYRFLDNELTRYNEHWYRITGWYPIEFIDD